MVPQGSPTTPPPSCAPCWLGPARPRPPCRTSTRTATLLARAGIGPSSRSEPSEEERRRRRGGGGTKRARRRSDTQWGGEGTEKSTHPECTGTSSGCCVCVGGGGHGRPQHDMYGMKRAHEMAGSTHAVVRCKSNHISIPGTLYQFLDTGDPLGSTVGGLDERPAARHPPRQLPHATRHPLRRNLKRKLHLNGVLGTGRAC
jgi:hypothetical protein